MGRKPAQSKIDANFQHRKYVSDKVDYDIVAAALLFSIASNGNETKRKNGIEIYLHQGCTIYKRKQ